MRTSMKVGTEIMRQWLKKTNRVYVLWAVFFLLMTLLFLRFFIFIPSEVTGRSMEPTLQHNDRVVVSTISQIERFDIVIFNDPNDTVVVKRVIGLPGETVHYRNEQLFIDNEPVVETFLEQEEIVSFPGIWTSDYTLISEDDQNTLMSIPENYYFLMGDNRRFSYDSRFYGSISEEEIIGKVKLVYYPVERFQFQ